MIIIIKKNGKREEYNFKKIEKAIELAKGRSIENIGVSDKECLYMRIEKEIKELNKKEIFVNEIHEIVIKNLKIYSDEVAGEYSKYRDYKKRFNKTFSNIVIDTTNILESGDKENANKDSNLISTQKELIAGVVSKAMTLDYELKEEWAEAHRSCLFHIHDLTDYIFRSFNCCLFDMGSLLKGGFLINGIKKKEPNSIKTAISLMSDVIMSASSQQFGGFTVPEVDKVLAPYVVKSKEKYYKMLKSKKLNLSKEDLIKWVDELVFADVLQGIESIEHRLNTINNSNGQTSFTTFTFGLDESDEGRLISSAILKIRYEGLGENKVTAIFPKLVFLVRDEINGKMGSRNYDLYLKAINVSIKRMYPDYLSLNVGYLGDVFDKYGKAISPMGCRAFLSLWLNEEGEAVFVGRANCGAVSLNLPRYAIMSEGNKDKFYEILDKYFNMAIQVHLYKYEKLRKQKASSNPLFFTQGGCHIKLDLDDNIEKAINTFTWSIGYIGIDEVCRYFYGEGVNKYSEFGVEILRHLEKRINEAKEKFNLLFSLYSTPAEAMCYRFLKADKREFGIIKGVTDKEYYTNSFHIQVREEINGIKKQIIESKMFHIATGGRIVYNEYPHTKNVLAIKQSIDNAMKLGLYKGINLQLDSCLDCNNDGEFKDGICPKCGSNNVLEVNRVCGYLGYRDRFNKGKKVKLRREWIIFKGV